MKCPACGNNLEQTAIEDITLDVCRNGCGGIWFDRFELDKVDEAHESAGEALLATELDPDITVDHDRKRKCPKCDMPMMRHFYSPSQHVEVDECPQCAGVWLDAGELQSIRERSMSEDQRNEAANKYFSEIFDVQLEHLRSQSQEETAKIRRLANMFKYICPSYYIPGNQKWGLF